MPLKKLKAAFFWKETAVAFLLLTAIFSFSGYAAITHFIPQSDNFKRVLGILANNYVDPHRLQPKEMLKNSLDSLSYFLPAFEFELSEETLKISMGENNRQFPLQKIEKLEQLAPLLEHIAQTVKELHYDPKDFDRIDQIMINGIMRNLDPHTALLVPDVYVSFSNDSHGNYSGVGMVITQQGSRTVVVKVYSDSPALKNGVRSQDVILEVDGESTLGWTTDRVSEKLRGEEGTNVKLLLERIVDGEKTLFTAEMLREKITLKSVFGREFKEKGGRIGYIKITQFTENTSRELNYVLDDLNIDLSDFKGIVLDLRDNPGGYLSQAISVSDKFLTEGDIVFVATVDDKIESEAVARPYNTIQDMPLVVLINTNSASASEIVAAALKKNSRAILIGGQSFGKGSVQTVIPLPDGSGLKFTNSKYLTPAKISIQSVGISPNVRTLPYRVKGSEFSTLPLDQLRIESDLDKNFAEWGNEKDAPEISLPYLYSDASSDSKSDEENHEQIDWINFASDFDFTLAKKVLFESSSASFSIFKTKAYSIIRNEAKTQSKKIKEAMTARGIDWSGQPTSKPGNTPENIKLSITHSSADGKKIASSFSAGEALKLSIEITNSSASDLNQTYIHLESESRLLSNRQIAVGKIKAGAKASADLTVDIPEYYSNTAIAYTVVLLNTNESRLSTKEGYFSVEEKPMPYLTYKITTKNFSAKGNQTPSPASGDTVELNIALHNPTSTPTGNVSLTLKNADSDSLEYISADSGSKKLQPGEETVFSYEIKIKDLPPDEHLDFSFTSFDSLFPKNKLDAEFRIPVGSEFPGIENAPPQLELISEKPEVIDGQVAMNWKVSDDKQWKEVYAFLNDDKVFYLKNSGTGNQKVFSINLSPQLSKINKFTIFVKDSDDIMTFSSLSFLPR